MPRFVHATTTSPTPTRVVSLAAAARHLDRLFGRRTYYLFQMPRWDTRLRIALDWTVALCFRPDLTKVDLADEHEQERRNCPAGVLATAGLVGAAHPPAPDVTSVDRAVSYRLSLRHRALEHRPLTRRSSRRLRTRAARPSARLSVGREAAAAGVGHRAGISHQEKGHHCVYTDVDVRSLRSSWPLSLLRNCL